MMRNNRDLARRLIATGGGARTPAILGKLTLPPAPRRSASSASDSQIIRESSGGVTPAFAADSSAAARKIPCAMVEVDSLARAA